MKIEGVSGSAPTYSEMSTERFGRNDSDDRLMVAAALLAFDIALPTELAGMNILSQPDREERWVRKLFEKAVGRFYQVVLPKEEWKVQCRRRLDWQIAYKTELIKDIFPGMEADIVLDNLKFGQRIVIDTKFTSIVTKGHYRKETLRSNYIFQIYTYLRSQVGSGELLADNASGLLLHPSIGEMVDETVVIQGHSIRFATVDLTVSVAEIRSRLLHLCEPQSWPFWGVVASAGDIYGH